MNWWNGLFGKKPDNLLQLEVPRVVDKEDENWGDRGGDSARDWRHVLRESHIDNKSKLRKIQAVVKTAPLARKILNIYESQVVGYGPSVKFKQKNLNIKWQDFGEQYGLGRAFRGVLTYGKIYIATFVDKKKIKMKYFSPLELTSEDDKYYYFTRKNETYKLNRKTVSEAWQPSEIDEGQSDSVFSSVYDLLLDIQEYLDTEMIRQKTAATFVGVITQSALTKNPESTRKFKMVPGQLLTLKPGETFTPTSPSASPSSSQIKEYKEQVANGVGLSYESVTGDYSQSTYSSSRLGFHLMRKTLDLYRYGVCETTILHNIVRAFYLQCMLDGITITNEEYSVTWPQYGFIDPLKEIEAEKQAVEAGFKSKSAVIREMGEDPEVVFEEIKKEQNGK